MNRRTHLKVKIKSLAEEARIIRKEEFKAVKDISSPRLSEDTREKKELLRQSLYDHRTGIVRSHARNNLLAYGLLNGTPYSQIESKCKVNPDLTEVTQIAKRFGAALVDIANWNEEASVYLRRPITTSE